MSATLSYDRLGVGRSAHPDGISVVQISYEVAQAASIAQRLRAGTLADVGKFDKVVAVGHCTFLPSLTRAAVLTESVRVQSPRRRRIGRS